MYRKHFGLTRHPFGKDLVPEDLFVSAANRELEIRLGHLLDLRGIGLVTGEVGSGKTTLCRKVTSALHSGLYRVLYVPLTTGNAMWNLGTCTGNVALGTDGTWVASTGTSAPHNPNCIAYWSNGHSGANEKGICSFTSQGYIGLWLNPGGHKTSPYHTKCLEVGTVSSTLTLTFTQGATLYTANDGTGRRILDFSDGTAVTGQLVYTGTATDYTTGTGAITATDGDGGTWTLDLTQAAFFWYTGAVNGDVIGQLQSPGVEAVACNAAVGCVLTTVQLGS
jgi:hypothetical protein